jgi:molybdenum cofactor cytidylyltransferase
VTSFKMKISQALRLRSNDVVAFVGGGGKTTAMFRLADELANASPKKMRVLTTTSTRIFAAQIKRAPAHVTFDPERQTIADILPQLRTALAEHSQALLIGRADPESGKAFGVPPDTLDALAATGHFDVILNEADGSRMRPFKAPADHEPVIPSATTVVVPMVGLDALGQPLTKDTVHRAERVSQLSGTPAGQPVTAGTVAAILCHSQGGLKNVPTQARVVPLLNKVEGPTSLAAAREIATKLLACQHIEEVAMGAVQKTEKPLVEVHGRTAAVVLAAGGSSRFGSPKQLARWGDKTFIEQVADTALASGAELVVVVLGAEIEQSRAVLDNRPVRVVINNNWAQGQSTSLKAGLAALPPAINSAVFLLVDLPAVRPEIVDALIERHRQTLAPIVWPEFEGKRGNPVLFDRRLFAELAQVSGDTGGRPVLVAYKDQAERIELADEAVIQDFDRPEDLAANR